jgi:type IV pilus assembly protein PilW
MALRKNAARADQSGFTLVEIMVGLAIGMLLTVVIVQVMSAFESQTRSTTGTADAQTNGGIALFTIASELQTTGFALLPVPDSPLECATLAVNGVADATVPNRLTPFAITDGATAAGDTLTLRYGTSAMGGAPTPIMVMGAPTANDATVGTTLGCQVGETTLVINGPACAMSRVTAVSAVGIVPKTITLADTTAAVSKANLSCLGTWNEISYAANAGNLERNGIPSVSGVVSLQAQYGVSATTDSNVVAQWVNASGATWAAPSVANRNRIKAVRIAIIARNAKMETSDVTAACSSTTLPAPTGLCAWEGTAASPAPAIDLSTADANWKRYRYRVFETIIPLRNVIWARETL